MQQRAVSVDGAPSSLILGPAFFAKHSRAASSGVTTGTPGLPDRGIQQRQRNTADRRVRQLRRRLLLDASRAKGGQPPRRRRLLLIAKTDSPTVMTKTRTANWEGWAVPRCRNGTTAWRIASPRRGDQPHQCVFEMHAWGSRIGLGSGRPEPGPRPHRLACGCHPKQHRAVDNYNSASIRHQRIGGPITRSATSCDVLRFGSNKLQRTEAARTRAYKARTQIVHAQEAPRRAKALQSPWAGQGANLRPLGLKVDANVS